MTRCALVCTHLSAEAPCPLAFALGPLAMVAKTEKQLLTHFGASNANRVKELCTIQLDLDPLCSLIGKMMTEITIQNDR